MGPRMNDHTIDDENKSGVSILSRSSCMSVKKYFEHVFQLAYRREV